MSSRHQILPLLIHCINQPILFGSRPLLQLLLPGYGLLNIRKRLKVHQLMTIILLRKPRYLPLPMFRHTPLQIIRHTNIQRRVTRIGKNVNIVLFVHISFLFVIPTSHIVISTNVERSHPLPYCHLD